MKLVREHVNEKFVQDSDPIADLGIGGFSFIDEVQFLLDKFNPEKKLLNFDELLYSEDVKKYWKKRLEDWFLGKSATGIFARGNSDSHGAYQKYTTERVVRIETFFDENNYIERLTFALVVNKPNSWINKPPSQEERWVNPDEIWYYQIPSEEKIFVNEINEKFVQDSDPVHDLGIGLLGIYQNLKAGDIFILKKSLDNFGILPGAKLKITKVWGPSDDNYIYVDCEVKNNEYDQWKRINSWGWDFEFFKEFFEPTYIKEFLNEKFVQNSDPVKDMNIGLIRKFKDICKTIKENIAINWESFETDEDELMLKANAILQMYGRYEFHTYKYSNYKDPIVLDYYIDLNMNKNILERTVITNTYREAHEGIIDEEVLIKKVNRYTPKEIVDIIVDDYINYNNDYAIRRLLDQIKKENK